MSEPDCTCAVQAPTCEMHDPLADLRTALRDLLSITNSSEYRFPEDQAIVARARAALKAAGG